MLLTFIILLIISFLISFILTPITIRWAKKFNMVDDVRHRPHPAHTPFGSIPRAGGVPIFLGIFIPILFFLKLNSQISGIFLGALILILVGLWDDRRDRSPYLRFLFNCLSALAVIMAGINIPYITNPLGGVFHFDKINFQLSYGGSDLIISLAHILAVIWIVWTTNIVGWSGGVDGQLPGFVSISAIVIGILSLRYVGDPNQYYVTAISFLTAGAFLGFLPWNYYPQKIMPGYGGKTLAGFMLSVLSILSFAKFGTALLVLAVPMTDAAFILFRRIVSGNSPVKASTGHLHHHLLKIGWGKRRIALFYWSISLLAGMMALVLSPKMKLFAVVLIVILIFSFIIWINFFKRLPEKQANGNTYF